MNHVLHSIVGHRCIMMNSKKFASPGGSSKKYRVLFEIECDLAVTQTIILASVSQYSLIPEEQEVLFDTGAVFEITCITTEYSGTINENW